MVIRDGMRGEIQRYRLQHGLCLKCGYDLRANWTDTTRHGTMGVDDPTRQVFDLWEAVHPVPETLLNWTPDVERRLLAYLDDYNAKWPEPRLRHVFEAALREASRQQ